MFECIERDADCAGEVREQVSRSGATVSARCEFHRAAYERRMDEVERDVQSRFPGYDRPGSPAPAWFDPAYAGERWDEDD